MRDILKSELGLKKRIASLYQDIKKLKTSDADEDARKKSLEELAAAKQTMRQQRDLIESMEFDLAETKKLLKGIKNDVPSKKLLSEQLETIKTTQAQHRKLQQLKDKMLKQLLQTEKDLDTLQKVNHELREKNAMLTSNSTAERIRELKVQLIQEKKNHTSAEQKLSELQQKHDTLLSMVKTL